MFTKIKPSTEDFSCSCCNNTMADAVMQDLEQHYDKPNLLYRDLRQWIENGFARFSWPLHERLFYIEGPSERVTHARDVMVTQLGNIPEM
jgi:hypothetical protein